MTLRIALLSGLSVSAAPVHELVHGFGASPLGGAYPYAGLASDDAGNLWGTTYEGGADNLGTIFKHSHPIAEAKEA